MPFRNRIDAGRQLARALRHLRHTDLVVLGLPRGGVPVAAEVAKSLGAALDVVIVRKLGVPGRPEIAMGAIGEGDARVVNDYVLQVTGVTPVQFAAVERAERAELLARVDRLRQPGARRVAIRGRTVVIVDDGIATGATVRVACAVVRAAGSARVIIAAPVAPPEVVAELAEIADEVVCLETPPVFSAVGQWYEDFRQVTDAEVTALLRPVAVDGPVLIPADGVLLAGHLGVPPGARGLVIFVHGTGSGRHSPRNRAVADALGRDGFGTLLFDLLAPGEDDEEVGLVARTERLIDVTAWLRRRWPHGKIGYFGGSTGAGVALAAAASPDTHVSAVVSRGGRPDLALACLPLVTARTLLIVGGDDLEVIRFNQLAAVWMRCPYELAVLPGATHLFGEPGALAAVIHRSSAWFARHLT
ncbi:putative phosphoribosyl transferase [Allocatelliglobosispora scoriae]|uniref:Putative phosphoribosyl transferase n=1 Tax=Allocatelliglobosispora scoriae TaxID=643052 RepID=A0A841BQH9_9ACTN|nr:alpha/beta fold hydrolase [Allocatelliglobosispora scoriae]MBB5869638.1 putative phosphoribosyl transferase [Allocatelliglobosispora scoriae]